MRFDADSIGIGALGKDLTAKREQGKKKQRVPAENGTDKTVETMYRSRRDPTSHLTRTIETVDAARTTIQSMLLDMMTTVHHNEAPNRVSAEENILCTMTLAT